MALFIFMAILRASLSCLNSLKRYSKTYLSNAEIFYEGSFLDDFLDKEINISDRVINLDKLIIFYKKENKIREKNNYNYSIYIEDGGIIYRQAINSERELSYEELEKFFSSYRIGRNLITKGIEYFNLYIEGNLLVLEFKYFSSKSHKKIYDISYKLKNIEGDNNG